MTDQRFTLDVPPVFAVDHAERDLPTGIAVGGPGKFHRYLCTEAELREWLSDARLYSDCAGFGWDMGPGAIGMQSSAQATARRVTSLMETEGVSFAGPSAE